MHTPVLLKQVIDGLQVHESGRYIDGTVGEGGHARAMLARGAYVLGIDQDKSQIEKLEKERLPRLTLATSNFASIEETARKHGFLEVDGILFDLGISWGQLSTSGKGLSYKHSNEPLDMRLEADCEETAADILATRSEDELYAMLARNSEELRSRDIASALVAGRKRRPVKTVGDLTRLLDRMGGLDGYSRVFQALRIEVNHEFANLEKGLSQAIRLLNQHGRIAVITFHSVEDRMVKRFIREGNHHQIVKKAIAGDRSLSFERSAKLRIFGI